MEAKREAMTTEDDLNTTVPNIRPDEWRMPEPVFQKTSGRLPESFVQRFQPPDAAEPDAAHDPSVPLAPEPQPKRPTLKVVIVVLALAAMIAFIGVFLTVVYFMFLR